jgi:hypothetical protein
VDVDWAELCRSSISTAAWTVHIVSVLGKKIVHLFYSV